MAGGVQASARLSWRSYCCGDSQERVTAAVPARRLIPGAQTRTLTPFGIYCIVAGLGSLVYLQLIK